MQFNWTSNNFFKKIISALGSEWPGATNDNWDTADTELANRHKKNEDVLPDTDNTRSIGSAIKRFLNAHFGQITLGGVTRSTWPASGSATVGLTDVLANGSEGNIPVGLKAALRNSTGINTWFSVDEATGNVGIGVSAPTVALDVAKNTEIVAGFSRADDASAYITVQVGEAVNNYAGVMLTSGSSTPTGWSSLDALGGFRTKIVQANPSTLKAQLEFLTNGGDAVDTRMIIDPVGNVGIGMTPTVQLELSGSIGQKASGTNWSNPSDERLKNILGPADLQRCYDDIKALAQYLIRYRLKDDCFRADQAKDRTLTGFAAGDVQKVIPKAVNIVPFTKVAVPDGIEEYEEQEFVVEQVEVQEIKLVAGQPILARKLKEQKRMLADEVQVKDDLGNLVVYIDDKGEKKPLMHSVPRMAKKTRPKERREVIADCLNLDMSQIHMQLLGAVMKLMEKVEALEAEVYK